MLQLTFTAQDLSLTRFAFSPLWEVVASIRVLREPAAHALHLPWIKATRVRLASSGLDLGPLTIHLPQPSNTPGRTLPGYLAPTPQTPTPDLADELELLAGTDPAKVPGGRPALDELVTTVAAYWELAFAPSWPRLRDLLEGDVLYRARRLAAGGAPQLFADLDPAIAWAGDTLTVRHAHVSETRRLHGRGLVLVPSAFLWPHVASKTEEPWQPVLRYPVRGVATLWERGRPAAPDALASVVGRSRALLLAELDSPASTGELARRTGLTAGGVSQHLGALRSAGLVTSHRTGRVVLYTRTARGDALLGDSPGT
jgi:DNA-binding transcriptional ArsR family regulator